MKPVNQTKFGNEEGNCFAASIASILEVGLRDLPELNSYSNKNWFGDLWNYLRSHGYTYVGTIHDEERMLVYDKGVKGYYVVCGDSPRGFSNGHAVVYYKGKLAHDPYPTGNGILKFRYAFMIEPIDSITE